MDFNSDMSVDEATSFLGQYSGAEGQSNDSGESVTPESVETPEQGSGTSNEAPQENVWFDAKKVPAELQPTFREMQASWTRKTQEAAEAMKWHRSFTENYGDINEVQGFLDTLRDPDGLRDFVSNLAEQLGITQAQAQQVMEQQAQPATQQPSAPNPNDPNRPMTMGEFMQWQQQIQQQESERQEDSQLDGIIRELEIPEELQYHVLAEANRLPAHLGYAERIKRANTNITSMLEAHAAKAAATQQEVTNNTPASLAGSMPQGAEEEAKTFDDAYRLSMQDMKAWRRS